jgi:hypothetical protein
MHIELDVAQISCGQYRDHNIKCDLIYLHAIPRVLKIPTNLPNLEGLVKSGEGDIIKYFDALEASHLKIRNINGETDSQECDYCSRAIYSICDEVAEPYYFYSYDNNTLMCRRCYDTTTGEIDFSNQSKRRHQVKVSKNDFVKRFQNLERYCDGCGRRCYSESIFYTNDEYEDACIECVANGNMNVAELNLEKKATPTSKDLEQNDRFGSRVDWVPLYLSMDTCDFILYCANPRSSLYGRIALAIVDKHGQMNVFTCSETDTIENLIDEYREQRKCDGNESIYSDDGDKWIVAYNSPIKKMMRKRRMPMYLYQDPPNTCMYHDG